MEHKNWTDGYSSEVTYTKGYYKTQSPRNMALAILARGFMPPKLENFRYLELGFGQGLSLNIHAAAFNGEFWGCDFNPQHALHAQELAAASGANAKVLNDSFEELLARDDLPEFDYISMHGVWSWVSDKNREAILELLRRKLKVGGALQVSYNCHPGWAPIAPLVNLMKLHKDVTAVGTEDPRVSFKKAIEFANTVSQADAKFFASNPDAKAQLEVLKNQETNYLVHEYFHDFWPVMPFSEVAKSMSSAKLDYACPADILSHLDAFNLTQNHINLINSIGDVVLRETVRDYCMNRRFRSDIFIKGPRSLSIEERDKLLRDMRFVLVRHPKTLDYTATALDNGGTISLNKEVVEPVASAMADKGFEPKTIAELNAHKTLKDRSLAQIAETLVTLTGSGIISPAAAEGDMPDAQSNCQALNDELLRRTDIADASIYLASPCSGQGVATNRVQQYFVLAIQDGKKNEKDWVDYAWDRMAARNFRIIMNNERIEEEDKNKDFLTEQASLFGKNQVPLLKAHGVL